MKPFLRYGFAVGCVSLLFNCISLGSPWLVYSGNTPEMRVVNQVIPGTENTGEVGLTEIYGCVRLTGDILDTQNRKSCAVIPVIDLAVVVKHIRDASSVALAFLLLAVPVNVLGLWLTGLRAFESITTLPACLSALKYKRYPVAFHAIGAVFCVVSFATFAGIMNAKFDLMKDGAILGFGGAQNRKYNYGGGFGLAIISFLFSATLSILHAALDDDEFFPPLPPAPPVLQGAAVANPVYTVGAATAEKPRSHVADLSIYQGRKNSASAEA